MKREIDSVIEKIKNQYNDIDTILLFGSALTPDWTNQSDVDIFLIDDTFIDSRSENKIDGIDIEYQKDNFLNILKDIETERGNLLHRNLSTMIDESIVVSSKSPEKVERIKKLAKEVLSSKPEYDNEDIKMWKYSISDYLAKAEKDLVRNDEIAFYLDTYYVFQNALEMSLAKNGVYMPQPKHLESLLETKDSELLNAWKKFIIAGTLEEKLDCIKCLENRV